MIRALALLALLIPAVASAEERRVGIGSFERLRITGAFDVTVTTGGAPRATLIGDSATLGDIDLHSDGDTLTIRRDTVGRWSERGQGAVTAPLRILLATPRLSAITSLGGSRIAASRLTGTRVDLAMSGTGAMTVGAVAADRIDVQLVGDGKLDVAGRVATARLRANGAGTIAAASLDAGDLTVALDGTGTIAAQARYTAQVTSTGLGTVSVAGRPKCRVTANAGAPVTCGDGARAAE